ncbi:hypothetical protein O6P37_07555 [Mycobacterium sp. CPCC 205372]|uniref:Secreted protein n=1 Tax=Mycobacterium hippophais TaxID=3016340 RepID=A0ABT4PQ72_9MYCO|nr:hypothetical protein [Mycobacterium hippophais]MCZ8378708.1 hypothetical protein [Mycobacterium hippophais]
MLFPIRPAVATAAAFAAMMSMVGSANAQPAPPPPRVMHHVKYTVFTEVPVPEAEIYYRNVDPPNWAEYSHNSYKFSPKTWAALGPDQMWTLDVMLADPDQWAMVTATTFYTTEHANFHCVLAVDGVVVKTDAGPKGALCSIRPW